MKNKHIKIDIKNMTGPQIRIALGITDPKIRTDKNTYSYTRTAIKVWYNTSTLSIHQMVDAKDEMFDVTKFQKDKLNYFLEEVKKFEDRDAKYEEQDKLRNNLIKEISASGRIHSPDQVDIQFHRDDTFNIILQLKLSNPEQAKRVMDFVNGDPEMGPERMMRVLDGQGY